ncbi:nucleoside deaminase, partial [Halorubrum sp. SD612]
APVSGAGPSGRDRAVCRPGGDAARLVPDAGSDNRACALALVRAVVRRAGQADVSRVVIGGESVAPRGD